MESIILTDQQTAAMMALEAQEHAGALEQVLDFGRSLAMLRAAGLTDMEAQRLYTMGVN